MPLCTSCTHHIDYLYTVYSKHNVRLEQCVSCIRNVPPHFAHSFGLRSEEQLSPICGQIRRTWCVNPVFFSSYYCLSIDMSFPDWLTIWLDLILMKPGVYRHLLFNRGASPRFAENVPRGIIDSRAFDGQDRVSATSSYGLPTH